MKCEFVYKCIQPIKCFALTKKFLFKSIFPKYTEMASEIKANSLRRYVRYIKRPINKEFDHDMIMKNKKSTYKQMFFQDRSIVMRFHSQSQEAVPEQHDPIRDNDGISPIYIPPKKNSQVTKRMNMECMSQTLIDRQKKEAKMNDIEINNQLRDKMNLIRKEVENFNVNIDQFSAICDSELTSLFDNVEKVTQNLGK